MIIAVALGALFFPIEQILPPLVAVTLFQATVISIKYRRGIDMRLLFRGILPLVVVGMPLGFWLYRVAEDALLKQIFGAFVCLLALIELVNLERAQTSNRDLGLPKRAALLIGAGITHGLYACGGPMVVYVASREITDKFVFRSTLHALWVVLDVVMLTLFLAEGAYDVEAAKLTGILVPPTIVSMFAGVWVYERINPKLFRTLVYAMLLVAGAALVVGS
jgi:uncharacterized membrane protein YfcA